MAQTSVQKLLIAEDYKPVRELLANLFMRSGFDVHTSCDGTDAIRKFYREKPDILITDLNLPRMNGYELCQRVRLVSNIPIIVMTGSGLGDGTIIQTAIAAGADAILSKPFSLGEIRAQIEGLLAR